MTGASLKAQLTCCQYSFYRLIWESLPLLCYCSQECRLQNACFNQESGAIDKPFMTLFVCLNVRRQHLHWKVTVFLELHFYLPNSQPASEVHPHNIYTDTSVSFVFCLYHQRMRILAMYSVRENDTLHRNVNCLSEVCWKTRWSMFMFQWSGNAWGTTDTCTFNRNASWTGSQGSKEFISLQKTQFILFFISHVIIANWLRPSLGFKSSFPTWFKIQNINLEENLVLYLKSETNITNRSFCPIVII